MPNMSPLFTRLSRWRRLFSFPSLCVLSDALYLCVCVCVCVWCVVCGVCVVCCRGCVWLWLCVSEKGKVRRNSSGGFSDSYAQIVSYTCFIGAKDKSNHLTVGSLQRFTRRAGVEQLRQVKRMIGGLENMLFSIYYSLKTWQIQWFLSVNLWGTW